MSHSEIDCIEALQLFDDWQGSLSDADRELWENHLMSCALCQESGEMQAFPRTWQMLGTISVPEISSDFDTELLHRIQDLDQVRLQRKIFWKRIDMLVDYLHIPAVAIVLTLLVWVGSTSQNREAQLPEKRLENLEMLQDKLQALNEVTVQESLEKIQKVYLQRSEG